MSTLKLERIDLLHVRRRLTHPFRISVGSVSACEFVVMRGYLDGIRVYSEANIDATPYYAGETVDSVWSVCKNVLFPKIIGKEFETIDEARKVWSSVRGNEFAKAAVEHLYWDLQGKLENKSIQELLGGRSKQVTMGTSHSIFDCTDELVQDVQNALDAGIKRIKIKIEPGWDEKPLTALRKKFGDITLMVDANAGYNGEDLAHIKELDKFNLLMIEQPFAPLDLVFHNKLIEQNQTPICLDEGAHNLDTVRSAVEFQAGNIINIKVGRVGGLSNAKAIHDFCQTNNIPVWCGKRGGSSISTASEVALASLPGFKYPTDHGGSFMTGVCDHLIDPSQYNRHEDKIDVPKGAGIGVEVDEKTLQRVTMKSEAFLANH